MNRIPGVGLKEAPERLQTAAFVPARWKKAAEAAREVRFVRGSLQSSPTILHQPDRGGAGAHRGSIFV
jgi:hypothetical protein